MNGTQRRVLVNALCAVVWQKVPLGLKQHQTVKIKSVALTIVELHLSEGKSCSQAVIVSQEKILLNKVLKQFSSNFLKVSG